MTTPAHYSNLAFVRPRKSTASALKAEADVSRQAEAKLKRAIDRTAHILDRLEARASSYDEQMKCLKGRREAAYRRVKHIEEQTLTLMEQAGLEKLTGNKVTLLMRANAPSLVVEDQSQIPCEYIRTKSTNEPNKVAIKVALDRGIEIGGVRLIQSISLIRK
jgi:Gp157 protein